MKQLVCERCGGNNFVEQDGYRICNYCHTSFVIQPEDTPQKSSSIALNEDIKKLLQKCKDDPVNVSRYASLVLDMDPSNSEALQYLYKDRRGRL